MREDGHTYVMRHPYAPLFKIGHSRNVERRCQQLQGGAGGKVEIEITIPRDIEKGLHLRFSHKRIFGEWFSLSEQDLWDIRNIGASSRPVDKWRRHHGDAGRPPVTVTREQLEAAKDFLLVELSGDGPVRLCDVVRAASASDIGAMAITAARRELGVLMCAARSDAGDDLWFMRLPEAAPAVAN